MTNPSNPIDVWTHADPETEWIVTRNDYQPDREIITKPNGDKYFRDFTYNSNGVLIKRTAWKRL